VKRQRRIVVLAKNTAEANVYARRAGLPRFTYTCPAGRGSVQGLRDVDVHILPGFRKRPDQHAIMAGLRHGAGNTFQRVEMPEPKQAPPVDQGDGMGEQLTLDDLAALNAKVGANVISVTNAYDPVEPTDKEIEAFEADLFEIRDHGGEVIRTITTEVLSGEETRKAEQGEDAAPAPTRQRRSRCKTCGDLTLEPHDHSGDEVLPAELTEAVSAGYDQGGALPAAQVVKNDGPPERILPPTHGGFD
jgi:hypothetical protein